MIDKYLIPKYLIPKWLEFLWGDEISKLEIDAVRSKLFPEKSILKLANPDGEIGEYIVKDCRVYLNAGNNYEFIIESLNRKLVQRIIDKEEPPETETRRAELESMYREDLRDHAVLVGIPQEEAEAIYVSFRMLYTKGEKKPPTFINNTKKSGEKNYEISLEISPEWLLELSRIRLAFAMSLNRELNSESLLSSLPDDIIEIIGKNIVEVVGDNPLKVDINIIEDYFKKGGGKKKKRKSKKKKKKTKTKKRKSKHKTKRRKS